MILSESATVRSENEGKSIDLPDLVLSSINIQKNTQFYAYGEQGSNQCLSSNLYLSTVPLSSAILYCRLTLKNKAGTLHTVTNALKGCVNIQNTTAASLKEISIVEMVLDVDSRADRLTAHKLEEVLGKLRPDVIEWSQPEVITEMIPKTSLIDVRQKLELTRRDHANVLFLTKELCSILNLTWTEESKALVSAYAKIPALLISIFRPGTKLVYIETELKNTPGSLDAVAECTEKEANILAWDLVSLQGDLKLWRGFGLIVGTVDSLKEKMAKCSSRINRFDVKQLGW